MNYISHSQEHNRGTNITKVPVNLGIPQEIKSILQHLQNIFYTGLTLTDHDILVLSDTHRINVQIPHSADLIPKIYWFYVMFRVYTRGDVIVKGLPVPELRCSRTTQSYIDRLVLYTSNWDIPFETGIDLCVRIHHILKGNTHIIGTLIQRSIEKVDILDTFKQDSGVLTGESLALTPPPTRIQVPPIFGVTERKCHPKDYQESKLYTLYQQACRGEITETQFLKIASALCVVDMYRNMPNNSPMTSEFLSEYNLAESTLKKVFYDV